jgi:tetratricopeptide (TPR) repeat protein
MLSNEDDALARLQQAKVYKEQGTTCFKAGNFSKARVRYATCLAFTRGLPGREMKSGESMAQLAAQSQGRKLSKTLSDELNEFDAVVMTNIAACYLKLNKPHEALNSARDALEMEPSYWKAYLRLAEAKEKTKDYEGCLKVLDRAMISTNCGEDAGAVVAIRKIRELAQKGIKEEASRQRKAFSNIFERAREQAEK